MKTPNVKKSIGTKKTGLGPKCPGCGMPKNDWPGEGYTEGGQNYCCQGCAEGTGCTCRAVAGKGFSREGQTATKAEPRPGKQRSGAPAPKGELSGERDSVGTEEGIDEAGQSSFYPSPGSERGPKKEPAVDKTKDATPPEFKKRQKK